MYYDVNQPLKVRFLGLIFGRRFIIRTWLFFVETISHLILVCLEEMKHIVRYHG